MISHKCNCVLSGSENVQTENEFRLWVNAASSVCQKKCKSYTEDLHPNEMDFGYAPALDGYCEGTHELSIINQKIHRKMETQHPANSVAFHCPTFTEEKIVILYWFLLKCQSLFSASKIAGTLVPTVEIQSENILPIYNFAS